MQKFRIRTFFKNFLFLFNSHRPSNKPNVLIFSLPRSGSTWLQELIWTQPYFKYANEPLNLKGSFLRKISSINGFEELYKYETRHKVLDYFLRITEGRIHVFDPSPIRKYYRFSTSRIVFKVIHGGEIFFKDIAEHTNSKAIFLLRNPIAVALSRKQLPRIKELTSPKVLSIFSEEEKLVISETLKSGNDRELKILMWCIQNKLVLHYLPEDAIIIAYEQLITEPEQTLKKIAFHCDLPDLDKMIKSVSIPSAVSTQSESESVNLMQDNIEMRLKLIANWRNKVTDEEAKTYFGICEKLNFGIYSNESDLPNLAILQH